ncbi:MAG: YlxR family protein [Coprobacillus sp.]|nr:YlxR family protein [Coprobacillus sp.]
MKKEVRRMCLVTRESKEVSELIRFTLIGNEVKVDPLHKLGGRGYYISKDKEVIEEAKKRNLIHKILKVEVSSDFYDELLSLL